MKNNIKISESPILSFLFCHCEERSDAAIPVCHCELSKKVWQSHYSFISLIFIYLLFLTRILQLVFCISFYFFIVSFLAYNPNPLLLYKLNTKCQRLTTDFNNYELFLCNILPFSDSKTIKKLYFS